MEFAILGSGSKGNATLVRHQQTTLLIDNGFSLKETELRLHQLGTSGADIDAILVTHEHGDHLKGVGPLARKYALQVYISAGTEQLKRTGTLPRHNTLNCHHPFSIKDIEVIPFPVPHDARETCQFVFNSGAHRLGHLTDVGHITSHIIETLNGVDALVLECNHDPDLLRNGPYPPSLQARVSSNLGHLSNQQSAGLLAKIEHDRLQHLVAAHLSEQNNTPDHVKRELCGTTGCEPEQITIAEQRHPLPWRTITNRST